MDLVAKMDDYGKGAWIAAMILGFILFWPIGLAILAYMIWSGRMGCTKKHWKRGDWKRWKNENWNNLRGAMRPSGNTAFDEYKADTIRRLEEEQDQFRGFLDRLRKSKDQAEFDMFMTERKAAADAPPGPEADPGGKQDEPRPDAG